MTGQIVAVILSGYLASSIVLKKFLLSSYKCLILIIIAVALSLFLGAFGGLIPVAYLTTVSRGSRGNA